MKTNMKNTKSTKKSKMIKHKKTFGAALSAHTAGETMTVADRIVRRESNLAESFKRAERIRELQNKLNDMNKGIYSFLMARPDSEACQIVEPRRLREAIKHAELDVNELNNHGQAME